MIKLEEKASKILCSQHQKSIQYVTLSKSSNSKLLCQKCPQNNKIAINKASELLMDINQDHPLNYHIKELQKQYESLRKEIKLKVDELLDDTEDCLNSLINHKLSDKQIQHYLYDDKLNEQDFEKLQEILSKYYDFEQENQIVAKIPSNDMHNIYQVQQKCQKIASIIKAFYKSQYHQRLGTQQSQENLLSQVSLKKNTKPEKPPEKDKNEDAKSKGLYTIKEEITTNSVCHCIDLNKTATLIVCGLQGNNNEDNLVLIQKKEEGFKEFQTLVGHVGAINAVCIGKINNTIFSAGDDKTIRVWNEYLQSKENKLYNCKQIINEAHNMEIHCLCVNQLNNLLASGCQEGNIKIWIEAEEKWINSQVLIQHSQWVKSLSFNYDSTFLISGSGDKSICVWNLNEDWEHFQTLTEHTSLVNCVNFAQNENTFVSGSEDQTIKIWNQQLNDPNGKFTCIQQLEGGYYIRSVCFNHNSLLLVSGSYSNIKVWVKNHAGVFVLNQQKYFDSRQVLLSDDSKSLFSVNRFTLNIRMFRIKEKNQKNNSQLTA
ncbi:unnamed protein product (macronuclear) [Paramecium tetraurelia]|uniref:Uncharacterized protein n=1 Tax=Paramecium tetraurelia TaxID=5888 RepID=A0DNI3_PARTE|nr:uncharacterized protein GSPATT00018796001 [Paramecium tetraurelia]CAK84600.1 unnamed protein product [Paramecium tetraurelia]|eukprot:XP_001451997.1 hypothetical protein (macronuclear) [Paramecium tetraurelia strain d4-2]